MANLDLHGWPLAKLYTFQSPDTSFIYMLRRIDDQLRDPMDALIMPKNWHHFCVSIDPTSMRGVSVRIYVDILIYIYI